MTNKADNTVSVIDAATNTVTATVDVGSGPKAITVNPDGTKVYVANSDDNTISVIGTNTDTVIATVPVGYNPAGIAVTPDETKVYVANEDAELYGDDENAVSEIDADSNTVKKIYICQVRLSKLQQILWEDGYMCHIFLLCKVSM